MSCADIFSGINETQVLGYSNVYPLDPYACATWDTGSQGYDWDQNCLTRESSDYQSWYQQNIQSWLTQAYYDVKQQLPWFDIQSMMDTLYLYANPGLTDPTKDGTYRIYAASNRAVCLSVQPGQTAFGTPMWVESCNGTLAERFMYDRVSQEIYNPNSSACLDLQGGSSIPGTPVFIFNCLGGAGQRWTYDNENQVFRNMLGNALDVSGETPVHSKRTVVTETDDGSPAERWE